MSPHTKGNKQVPVTLKNISGERTPRSTGVLVKSCTKFDVCEENNSSSSLQLPLIPYRIAFHIGMKNSPLYGVDMALMKQKLAKQEETIYENITKLRTKFTFMADFLIYVLNINILQFQKRWKKLMLGGLKFVSRNGSNTLGNSSPLSYTENESSHNFTCKPIRTKRFLAVNTRAKGKKKIVIISI